MNSGVHPWNRSRWEALTGERERLPHALLLHGPAGVGKRRFALELARWLLCAAPTADAACSQCPSCHWFEQGHHPDFRLLEPEERRTPSGESDASAVQTDAGEDGETSPTSAKKASKYIRIEDVRAVGEFLSLVAHQHGWRVVILEPAERMNANAANALLKTLEEPPPRVMLILVSHQMRRLPATVLSRCRKLAFERPERTAALAWLQGEGLDASALDEAGGAPLLALEYADPERMLRRERFLAGLERAGVDAGFELAEEHKNRLDEAWGWMSRWLCDLLQVRAGGRPRYFPEHRARIEALARQASHAGLWRLQQELTLGARWLQHSLNGQILLESWFIRYAECMESSDGG